MSDQARFEQLLRARHPCISIVTFEEREAATLVRQAAIQAQLPLWEWSINGGVREGLLANQPPVPDTEHPAAALYHLSLQIKQGVALMFDIAGHLRDERTLRLLRETIAIFEQNGSCMVLLDHTDALPPAVKSAAAGFELSLPDKQELERLVKSTLRTAAEQAPVRVNLNRAELDLIVQNLKGLSERQGRQVILDCIAEDRTLDVNDMSTILASKRQALQGAGLLEYIQTPVDLAEIGGLNQLKSWLKVREQALSPAAGEYGLDAPRGMLMLGVQGAGKSLAAKAVATAWRWPLMRMDVGALYDKYIGESERRLRESLRQAEAMAPVILWIDEIEKAFASAASRSTDGGLSQRMFGSLLTWMQERRNPVFLIATANDIEALPPELLRKGRFDEVFFVDLPNLEARTAIFAIHLKKRKRDPELFDLAALAQASEGYSGAEIEQAIIAALFGAFHANVELSTKRIVEAVQSSPPLSVVMAERVAALRAWAQGRCVPAD